MIRLLLLTLCAIMVGGATPSFAQKTASPTVAASAPLPAISAAQARSALDVLNDPARRAAFTATLEAIVKAQPAAGTPIAGGTAVKVPAAGAAPVATVAGKPAAPTTVVGGVKIPLAPDSLGAQILLSASDFVSDLGNRATGALDDVQSLPSLYRWAETMATDQNARSALLDVVWRVALVLACAAAVEIGLRRALRRPIRRLESLGPVGRPNDPEESALELEPEDEAVVPVAAGGVEPPVRRRPRLSPWALLRRVPVVVARLLLELLPVVGIVTVGHLMAASRLGGHTDSRLIILAAVDSYAVCAALLCVARMLLSPDTSRLRLFQLRDSTATYTMRWTRRLILIAVFGYAIGEVGLLLGLSDIAHDALQKAVGLVLHLCLAIIVIQKRRAVGRVLRAPAGATGFVAAVRNRLAQIWHWVALFFLIAGWLVWAVEVPHGYAVMLHYFAVTALVMIGARLALLVLLGLVDRVMRPGPGSVNLYPGMQTRLLVYHPVVTIALRMTIYLLCILGLLQLYGLNTFLWLMESRLGLRILSASGTLLVTVVLAFGAWEAINGGVQQHLDRLQRESQLAKSARLRTLLPLLRTTVLITIAIIAGLMILGQIGINIAPLLAGAGIIGVAIGFGSQKLVQDLITGIFLLLENAMQVGDAVTVAGLSGNVEALSVRTIRLRAGDGSVHIIPFSSVTSVTNVNRGVGNASVTVSVAHDEDTDRVADELKAIVAGMRADPALTAMMLSDFQLWGVDKVDGAQVTIVGQVVCTDSGRWGVQREFNRRMKRRFQELGIRIFNPVQTITLQSPVQTPAEKGDDHEHAAAAN